MRRDIEQIIITNESLIKTNLYRLILSNDTLLETYFNIYYTNIKNSSLTLINNKIKPLIKVKKINIITIYRRLGYLFKGYLRRLF